MRWLFPLACAGTVLAVALVVNGVGEDKVPIRIEFEEVAVESAIIDASVPTLTATVPTLTATPELTAPPIVVPVRQEPVKQGTGGMAIITGYYCRRVEGWPLGDGGNYCGAMASGRVVYVGAAACGSRWSLGTVLDIEGYGRVVCEDRGYLAANQIDIFFESNADLYGSSWPTRANVEVVE